MYEEKRRIALKRVTRELQVGDHVSYPRLLLARAEQRMNGSEPPNSAMQHFHSGWSYVLRILRLIEGRLE